MKAAQKRAVKITRRLLSRLAVRPGQSEKEIAAAIRHELKKASARPAFRTIVASGPRSALPHGWATGRKLRRGDLVVIDFGAVYNGYRSDVTRTFVVGKTSARQRRVLEAVRGAQRRAIRGVRAGAKSCEIDRAARDYISRKGFGRYFIHSTGHGIGTRVHQGPKLSRYNPRRLRSGQIITIEPGIYIKRWGGARIEDMFEVTEAGCRQLTS